MPYVLVRLPATIDTNPVARFTALSGQTRRGGRKRALSIDRHLTTADQSLPVVDSTRT
jgi:hypothetical protein